MQRLFDDTASAHAAQAQPKGHPVHGSSATTSRWYTQPMTEALRRHGVGIRSL
mgnify:CR=1 FL=1